MMFAIVIIIELHTTHIDELKSKFYSRYLYTRVLRAQTFS